jgi:hypothetical protein
VAAGRSAADAYSAAGYAIKTAYTCGPRLLKTPAVAARVTELKEAVTHAAIANAGVSREFVLMELRDNALRAKQNQQWAASTRALELLGKELGMFVSHVEQELQWDGDPASLTDSQLDKLLSYFVRLDPDEARRQYGLLCLPPPEIEFLEAKSEEPKSDPKLWADPLR